MPSNVKQKHMRYGLHIDGGIFALITQISSATVAFVAHARLKNVSDGADVSSPGKRSGEHSTVTDVFSKHSPHAHYTSVMLV